jgi:chromosomal replication initiator protein
MIDDIQFIAKKESTQEEFFHTFNALYESSKQIVISSDRPPKELKPLEERLISRFEWGLTVDVQSPDYETRLAILMKKAEEENFAVEEEVQKYLAENFDTNIREMEGVLMKVWYYASLTGKKMATMEDVKEALKDHDFSNKQNLTAERIIDCVCKYFSVKKEDLLGKKKNKEIVEPRQICMYTICSLLDMPLLSIGQLFDRDHTTVIHARDKVTSLIEENQRIKIAVNDIRAMATKS